MFLLYKKLFKKIFIKLNKWKIFQYIFDKLKNMKIKNKIKIPTESEIDDFCNQVIKAIRKNRLKYINENIKKKL